MTFRSTTPFSPDPFFPTYDFAFTDRLHHAASALIAQGTSAANATTQALAGIYADLQQQALMLSYLDVFRIMMYGCLVVLTLVMFLRNVRKGEKAAVGH